MKNIIPILSNMRVVMWNPIFLFVYYEMISPLLTSI